MRFLLLFSVLGCISVLGCDNDRQIEPSASYDEWLRTSCPFDAEELQGLSDSVLGSRPAPSFPQNLETNGLFESQSESQSQLGNSWVIAAGLVETRHTLDEGTLEGSPLSYLPSYLNGLPPDEDEIDFTACDHSTWEGLAEVGVEMEGMPAIVLSGTMRIAPWALTPNSGLRFSLQVEGEEIWSMTLMPDGTGTLDYFQYEDGIWTLDMGV